jgi:hypothetical protein
MADPFAAGESFVLAQARLLERRLFATCLRGAAASGVEDALRGYRNYDGGFGHGLEPDKRCPASLPIDVEIALQTCAIAGIDDPTLLGPACDYLGRVAADADAGGAVPLAFPVIESYPRAEHWSEWTYEPGVNPTAGLAGLLYRLGFDHPWRDDATRYCWAALDTGELPDDAHALAEVMVFLDRVPDRARAQRHMPAVIERLATTELFHLDPDAPGYGLSPLFVAPTADAPARRLFDEELLGAHLDRLLADQQADGGWPITWEPPGPAASLEWRGVVTLRALRTLTSYGRLTIPGVRG